MYAIDDTIQAKIIVSVRITHSYNSTFYYSFFVGKKNSQQKYLDLPWSWCLVNV